jgi:hypothetical protein
MELVRTTTAFSDNFWFNPAGVLNIVVICYRRYSVSTAARQYSVYFRRHDRHARALVNTLPYSVDSTPKL